MSTELGLRERKKLRTRQLIAATAKRMFLEHGFDAVPVAAVARAVEVAESTVFSYFPTKEDLVLEGIETFETDLLVAVRARPVGESIVAACTRFLLEPRLFLATDDEDSALHHTELNRMIAATPALLSREREIFSRQIEPLAALIAEDTAADLDDIEPWVVAHALIGVQQSILHFARRKLLEGWTDHPTLVREVRTRAKRAMAQLEQGLGTYGVAPATRRGKPARRPGK